MELAPLSNVNVLVTDCVFINNSANPLSDLFLTTTDLIERQIFSGRGGGMAIIVKIPHLINIIICNILFENNYASNFGGGLYCYIDNTIDGTINGTTDNLTYIFRNNIFVGNKARLGSGAMSFINYGQSSSLHGIIYNCTFKYNEAKAGGCLHVIPSYHFQFSGFFFIIKESLFYNNTSTEDGGMIVVTLYQHSQNKVTESYEPVEFTNW